MLCEQVSGAASDAASSASDATKDVANKAKSAVPDVSLVNDQELGDPKKVADKVLLSRVHEHSLSPCFPECTSCSHCFNQTAVGWGLPAVS